jgi:hypothetical protein
MAYVMVDVKRLFMSCMHWIISSLAYCCIKVSTVTMTQSFQPFSRLICHVQHGLPFPYVVDLLFY